MRNGPLRWPFPFLEMENSPDFFLSEINLSPKNGKGKFPEFSNSKFFYYSSLHREPTHAPQAYAHSLYF